MTGLALHCSALLGADILRSEERGTWIVNRLQIACKNSTKRDNRQNQAGFNRVTKAQRQSLRHIRPPTRPCDGRRALTPASSDRNSAIRRLSTNCCS